MLRTRDNVTNSLISGKIWVPRVQFGNFRGLVSGVLFRLTDLIIET